MEPTTNSLLVPIENIENISPGGSPLTEKKLLDFLTVNGQFTNEHYHSSNVSTASSSLCASPVPSECETELENIHRLSLTEHAPHLVKVKSEIKRNNQRPFSMLTQTLSANQIYEDHHNVVDSNGLSKSEIANELLNTDKQYNSAQSQVYLEQENNICDKDLIARCSSLKN